MKVTQRSYSWLSLRGVPRRGTTKQSSWIATARFAHLAMTRKNPFFG
jgi:hypothetical protein